MMAMGGRRLLDGHLKSEMAAATGEFGRRRRFLRTVTATGHLSSSLLLLPSNLQFRCMKYLVFFGYL